MQGEQIGFHQQLRHAAAGAGAQVEQRLFDRVPVALDGVAAPHLSGDRSEWAKEIVDIVRGVAHVSQVDTEQAWFGFSQDGHRRGTLSDLRGAARQVARFIGADDQPSLSTCTTRAQHGPDTQQADRTAGAGVLDVEGGDRSGNGVAGPLQHSVDIGGNRLGLVDAGLGGHHQVAQRGDIGGVLPCQKLGCCLRGHGRSVLPPVREAYRHLTGSTPCAFQR